MKEANTLAVIHSKATEPTHIDGFTFIGQNENELTFENLSNWNSYDYVRLKLFHIAVRSLRLNIRALTWSEMLLMAELPGCGTSKELK